MRIRLRHVVHSGIVLVTLALVALAIGFIVDATQTNRTYDALAAHRVRVIAQVQGCAFLGSSRSIRQGSTQMCEVRYTFDHTTYGALIGEFQTRAFYVDPKDPILRMNAGAYDDGPTEVTGDIVFATLFLLLASVITVCHQIHLRNRRREQRLRQSVASDRPRAPSAPRGQRPHGAAPA